MAKRITILEQKIKTVRQYCQYRIDRLTERIEKLEYLEQEMKDLKKTFSNIIKKSIK